MPKQYIKTKDCGCVIKTISCGIEKTNNGDMYMLGGHAHLIICVDCKKKEDLGEDTLYDMWMNDNITDDNMYMKWKQYNSK
jgi:hypothetical protein